jgi:hypothetical protein
MIRFSYACSSGHVDITSGCHRAAISQRRCDIFWGGLTTELRVSLMLFYAICNGKADLSQQIFGE